MLGQKEKFTAETIMKSLPTDPVTDRDRFYVNYAKKGVAEELRMAGVMCGRYPNHDEWCFANSLFLSDFDEQVAFWLEENPEHAALWNADGSFTGIGTPDLIADVDHVLNDYDIAAG